MREKRPGVWEIRLFTGRDANGRPTQISKTFHGTKREARQYVAQLEGVPVAQAGGRTVADVLDAWQETNAGVWAEASRRDYASRAAYIAEDLGAHAIAGLSVADIERWHARMRRAGVGDGSIRSRHAALRVALGQAVRWGWLQTNVAASARLRSAKQAPRDSMTVEEVRAVIEAAGAIDPAAALALRLAAVAGARRSEIAALRWDDFDVATQRLRIDSSVAVARTGVRGEAQLIDAPTKTGDRRNVRLDDETAALLTSQRAERGEISHYVFSLTEGPPESRPHQLVVAASSRSGGDRCEVAPPRLAPLDRDDRPRQRPRRAHGRRPPRPRERGHDAAGVRARRRSRRRRSRDNARFRPRRLARGLRPGGSSSGNSRRATA
jgi:integrase